MLKRIVIYDGECGFCSRAIRLGKKLDWFKRVDWRPRLEPGLEERFPEIGLQETRNRMVSIRPDGRASGGFFAVRDIALRFPLTFLPALLLYIPGVSFFGVPAYQWVARNRHRFGGNTACSLPDRKK